MSLVTPSVTSDGSVIDAVGFVLPEENESLVKELSRDTVTLKTAPVKSAAMASAALRAKVGLVRRMLSCPSGMTKREPRISRLSRSLKKQHGCHCSDYFNMNVSLTEMLTVIPAHWLQEHPSLHSTDSVLCPIHPCEPVHVLTHGTTPRLDTEHYAWYL